MKQKEINQRQKLIGTLDGGFYIWRRDITSSKNPLSQKPNTFPILTYDVIYEQFLRGKF